MRQRFDRRDITDVGEAGAEVCTYQLSRCCSCGTLQDPRFPFCCELAGLAPPAGVPRSREPVLRALRRCPAHLTRADAAWQWPIPVARPANSHSPREVVAVSDGITSATIAATMGEARLPRQALGAGPVGRALAPVRLRADRLVRAAGGAASRPVAPSPSAQRSGGGIGRTAPMQGHLRPHPLLDREALPSAYLRQNAHHGRGGAGSGADGPARPCSGVTACGP
jgi:hypothetical protein